MFVSGSAQRRAGRGERRARAGGRRRAGRRARARRGRRRRGCPALWIVAAAEPLQVDARGRDRRRVAGEQRAERRAEALVQAERDRVGRGGERGERDAERDRRVREPRAVEVDARAVRRAAAERLGPLDVERPCRPRGCACSRGRAAPSGDALHVAGRAGPTAVDGDGSSRRAQIRRPRSTMMCADARPRPLAAGVASARAARRGSPSCTSATKTAASLPRSSAPRRSSSLTFSSSPAVAQPSSAARIASHISSVGGAQKSERRSITRRAQVAPGPRARCARRRRHGDAVHEHLVDALDVGERVLERRAVGEAVEVEHDEVGGEPAAELAAVGEAEVLRRHRSSSCGSPPRAAASRARRRGG